MKLCTQPSYTQQFQASANNDETLYHNLHLLCKEMIRVAPGLNYKAVS